MPIYEFECDICGFEFEKKCRVGNTRGATCPECKSRKVTKLMSSFISFRSKEGNPDFSPSSKCATCVSKSCRTCV